MADGKPKSQAGALGTFAGVFTPSVLTILGIILFLRLGYVVGSSGLGRALIIIAIANAISVLTSVSLSAIATNLKVKGGGDYYLISRTLGVEFGGAIGLVLFLAQSVSIAFYCLGFGEVVADLTSFALPYKTQVIAACAAACLFVLAWLGADWATKFQYVVMAVLAGALVSFYTGAIPQASLAQAAANWNPPEGAPGFWLVFAIFFPAVTGFTQGVSMSGDLKDPGKSLPLGTFLAVGISILVYFSVAMLFAMTRPDNLLAGDYTIMGEISLWGPMITAGVVAATLSSAMASFLGAPRILQSLAKDRIFPFLNPFAVGHGQWENPRRGVLLSAGIAFSTIALGQLNAIAPVVSMFFLISYGLLNYATFFETRAKSPFFRPRFRWFHSRLSLLGALGCLGCMVAINPPAGAVAIAVLLAIHQYLKRTAGPARWADGRRSYHLEQVRSHLIAAAGDPEHARDWRPVILAFSDHPARRERLLRLAGWLGGGAGLVTAVRMVQGHGLTGLRAKEEAQSELAQDIVGRGLHAFPLVLAAPDMQEGLYCLLQSFGVGPLKPNLALFNWAQGVADGPMGLKELRYGQSLRTTYRQGVSSLIFEAREENWARLIETPPEARRIDVFAGQGATTRLMLLLAYLMTRSPDWAETPIRLLAPIKGTSAENTVAEMRLLLGEARITAQPVALASESADALIQAAQGASLVFLPYRLIGNQLTSPWTDSLPELLAALPPTGLAMAAQDIDLDAEPEAGVAGEHADALDALSRAREASKEADQAAEAAAQRAHELALEVESTDSDYLAGQVKSAVQARQEAEAAATRAERARVDLELAARQARKAGALPLAPEEKETGNGPDEGK